MEIHDTRYAKTADGVYIAYQTAGEGPIDLVWEEPMLGPWLRDLTSFSRLILHDRRGTGLSSRNVPPPNLETRVSDLRLVLDAVGSQRPVLAGISEGGAANVLFAATEPECVHSIVWFDPLPRVVWTPDFPWGVKPEYVELDQRSLDLWGTNEFGAAWTETEATEGMTVFPEPAQMRGMMSRHTATPDVARELARIWYETDVRGVLPSVQAPTLLIPEEHSTNSVAIGEYVASLMPDAVVAPADLYSSLDENEPILDVLRRFLGVERPPPELDTILSTILFTDIVGSTEKQASLGDRGSKELVERHHAIVREGLARWRGIENDTAGDGFYATFDGPARAIRCALEVAERVRDLGIEIRAGVHTGECELIEGKCGGITVSIGARVASNAGPSEMLVFEDAGEHDLKGVPDRWHLYRVVIPPTGGGR